MTSKIQKILFNRVKNSPQKRVLKNPLFYFASLSFVLLCLLFFGSSSLAKSSYFKNSEALSFNPFFKNNNNTNDKDLFFSQSNALALETPDLKTTQDGFIYGITTPRLLTPQTLGAIFGATDQQRKEVIDYTIQTGNTVESLAEEFKISKKTIAWANNISENASLKVGQSLTILPFSGVIHTVKNGDTVSQIRQIYGGKIDDIVTDNGLASEGDIFIGDTLLVRNGIMPKKAVASAPNITLADNFFIYPAEGQITQGPHHLGRGIDVGNKCGTPIYAAASGIVQRAVSNGAWNLGMGNHITILHSSGIVTYYGHLMTLFIKPGDNVSVGDRIGLMGRTGNATGCHVHFEVVGAKNFLAKYSVGTFIKYK